MAVSVLILNNTPVTVPKDFLGMCYVQYPLAGNNPVGVIPWKFMRGSQMSGIRWSDIETPSAGLYSFGNLDQVITFNRQNGANFCFGMYATPTFYADSTVVLPNTNADNVTLGQWNLAGEGSYPLGFMPNVANTATVIATRYNTPNGAWALANPNLGKGIQYWENWNEPFYNSDGSKIGNGNVTGSGAHGNNHFWWGNASQLVDICWAQYSAYKAVDPSIIGLCPGWLANKFAIFQAFYNATGQVYTNITGAQTYDAIAYHPYGTNPPSIGYLGYVGDDVINGANSFPTFRAFLNSIGETKPIYFTEWGLPGNPGDGNNTAWYADLPLVRYQWICRNWMAFAAQGVRAVCPWHWGETSTLSGNSGSWWADTNGVQKAYNDFSANVPGKTIVNSTWTLLTGQVSLQFSDGSSWTV